MTGYAVALGLAAALCWGVGGAGIAVYARRGGVLRTLLLVHASGVVVLLAAAPWGLPDDPPRDAMLAALALGPIAALAGMAGFRAFALGPLGVCSPLISTYGGLIVVLAVVVLGEALSTAQAVACVVLLAGAVALSAPARAAAGTSRVPTGRSSGIPWATGALVGNAAFLFSLGALASDLGWLLGVLLSRASDLVALLVVCSVRGAWPAQRFTRPELAACAAVGLVDITGFLLYSAGGRLGEVGITTAASSAYPLVHVAFGMAALGERPTRRQGVGVAAVLGGLVALALG